MLAYSFWKSGFPSCSLWKFRFLLLVKVSWGPARLSRKSCLTSVQQGRPFKSAPKECRERVFSKERQERVSSKSVQQECQARVSGQECPARVPPERVPSKSSQQECQELFWKECQARVSFQGRPARASSKSAQQNCQARLPSKSVK